MSARTATRLTPERAKTLAGRWRFAGVAALVAGVAVAFFSTGYAMPLLVPGCMFLMVAHDSDGWRAGYLAREREERAGAGDPR